MDNKNFKLWKALLIIFFAVIFVGVLVWLMASKSLVTIQLVEGFPEFAVYPGATLKDSQATGEGEEMRYIGKWSANDSAPQVMKWHIEKLESNGWIIDVSPADPNASLVQFAKAYNEDFILDLSVIREQNSSLTNITVEFAPNVLIGDEER